MAVVTVSFQDTKLFNTEKTIMYLHINIEWHNYVFLLENISWGKWHNFYINNGKVAGSCRKPLIQTNGSSYGVVVCAVGKSVAERLELAVRPVYSVGKCCFKIMEYRFCFKTEKSGPRRTEGTWVKMPLTRASLIIYARKFNTLGGEVPSTR